MKTVCGCSLEAPLQRISQEYWRCTFSWRNILFRALNCEILWTMNIQWESRLIRLHSWSFTLCIRCFFSQKEIFFLFLHKTFIVSITRSPLPRYFWGVLAIYVFHEEMRKKYIYLILPLIWTYIYHRSR